MKKAIAILLTALLLLTVFVSCEGDVEDLFGDNITITFNGNGSTSGQMAALKVARGKEVRLTANAYEKTDSEFTGWNTKADGSGYPYEDEEFVYFEEDTTLYAQWSGGAVVTFHKNDGVTPESTTTQTIPFNTETALTKNSFSRDTYIFLGWNTAKDGTGTAYSDEQEVTLTANIDLYAQWAIDLATTTLSKTSWTTGNVYSMSADVPISDRITVTGSVTLILPKDKTLTASSGITVTGTNSLTINGKGSLSAGGSSTPANAAGIGGGGYNQAGGTITINGGTVTANGGSSGAGIGGGANGAGGTVIINGGTVTATGYFAAAGIGGGDGGNGGKVTINGGKVTANGGLFAAGIGGGYNRAGGTIDINGGTVTATGGSANEYYGPGAGIGGGYKGAGGTVAINGGTVTATGGSGSVNYPVAGTGIGAGSGSFEHGTLTIGENSTTPYTDGKLRIASGWFLYYGESSASTSIGEGTYASWSDYAKKYMNVTQPST